MTTTNIGEDAEKLELSYIANGNVETVWQSLTKLNMHLPYDLNVLFYIFTQEKWKHIPTKKLLKECSLQLCS